MRRSSWQAHAANLLSVGVLLWVGGLPGDAVASGPEHWIASWSTAQQLVPNTPPTAPPPGAPAPTAQPPSPIPPIPPLLEKQTVRMVVHMSAGGPQLRVQLANAPGNPVINLGAVHVARSGEGAAILPDTDRALSFGGRASVSIPPGAAVLSDPVTLAVAAGSDLTVSIYVPEKVSSLTTHPLGLHTSYILDGDATAAADPHPVSDNASYFWLADIEVRAAPAAAAIVAFGDSITDGFATSRNRDLAWPAVLYTRFQALHREQRYSVLNLGISGNRVLHDGAGASALARFDRDVLGQPGVRWMILLEGINDISYPNVPGFPKGDRITAEDLIAGYRMLIARAHTQGIRVMGATLLPWEGVWTFSADAEAIRLKVNQWIRTGRGFDGVVDFDAVTRDPLKPSRLNPAFDSGDHVHPNDAGNRAMAQAIDLSFFRSQGDK